MRDQAAQLREMDFSARSSLQNSLDYGPETIVVASGKGGVGKSVVSVLLALALRQVGGLSNATEELAKRVPPVIAATFTFRFIDGAGNDTDIDNNGVPDAAFREVYYTGNFPWAVGGNIDIQTVVLHETGHGLSQAHFGKAFVTNSNGALHFAPRAVMNAGYSGVNTAITATDNGGHCSNWGSWPSN